MTADPLPLTELLDQLERLLDGDPRDVPQNDLFAAVNLLRPMVEALRAAEAAMDYIDLSPCDPDIYPEQWAAYQRLQALDLRAHLAALRDAAALELEEKK